MARKADSSAFLQLIPQWKSASSVYNAFNKEVLLSIAKTFSFFIFSLFAITSGYGQSWSPPVTISNPFFSFANTNKPPELGVDDAGNAFAVWASSEIGQTRIRASRFDPASQLWSPPELIGTTVPGGNPSLAVTKDGKAIAVWPAENEESIFYNFYINGWNTQTEIAALTLTYAFEPVVGANVNKAIAAWLETDNTDTQLTIYSFDFSSMVWTFETFYSVTSPIFLERPFIAVNDASDAEVVFREIDTTPNPDIIKALSYNGAWSGPNVIATAGATATNLILPIVAIDSSGNAIAIWVAQDTLAGTYDIESAYSTDGFASSTLTTLSTGNVPLIAIDNTISYFTDVAFDASGDAVAVWMAGPGDGTQTVQASTFQTLAWSPPVTISDSGTNGTFPQVAVDSAGDAWAVWVSPIPISFVIGSIQGAKFTKSSDSWQTPSEQISQGNSSGAFLPNVATNSAGCFFSAWADTDGIVEASWTCFPPPPPPPIPPAENFKVCQWEDVFLFQTKKTNILTWTFSSGTDIVGYKILRNKRLLTFVGPKIHRFTDCTPPNCCKTTYAIIAVSASGRESEAVTFSIID
jgi:hypothetical protein